ncbi:TetR/AcrR family transcriptional regulator [Rhizobacter sp. P5_C2]
MAYQRTPYVESKRAEARDRFIEAGVTLLAQGGWRDVQMSAVAALAGLSTGALYLHFPSKTQLLLELYRVQAGKELDVTTAIAAQAGTARERLAAAIGSFAQRALNGGRLSYALVQEPTDNEVEQLRLQFHAEFIALFQKILDDGRASGELRVADTRVAAACVFGSITESLLHPLGMAAQAAGEVKRGRRVDASALIGPLVDFCFHGAAGEAAPAKRRTRS